MTYTLRIEKQGVKQLKALLKFTPPGSDARNRLKSFGLYAEGVVACDPFALGIATVGTGIRWHGDPADGIAVNAKTLVLMLPAEGATVTFDGDSFTVSSVQYEAHGTVDEQSWLDWRPLIPTDDGERHAPGFFNASLLSKFGALAEANLGKPKQTVRLNALHPAELCKAMTVTGEDGTLYGLLMPMRVG